MKQLKSLINNENKTRLIGILSILLILWIVLYLIPELFASLFNSILGNLMITKKELKGNTLNHRTNKNKIK